MLVPLAAAVALLAAFVYVEARVAPAPLVPLSIFKLSTLRAANLVVVLMYAALFSMFFFVTLYLQQVLGDDALQAGLSFLPTTLAVFTASSLAPRLVARLGVRRVVTIGMLFASAGLLILTGVRPGGSYFTVVLPGGVLAGLGMGLGLVPSTIAATQGVPRTSERTGVRAAEHLTARRRRARPRGAQHDRRVEHGSRDRREPRREALTNGFALAFQIGAAITIVAAVVAAVMLRPVEASQTRSP